jgi:hypothetical protein
MSRRLVAYLILATLLVPAVAVGPRERETEALQPACDFTLGFAALRSMIIPQYGDIVGQCLENEWHNAFNGDGLQRTTGGLMAWRKADNWTAFTNGSQTWLNGPCGLQVRLNPEIGGTVFAWEGRVGSPCTGDAMVPAPPPQAAPPPPAEPAPPEPGPTATPVPAPAEEGPSLRLEFSDGDPRAGDEIEIRILANHPNGVDWIRWEGESRDSDNDGDNGGGGEDDPALSDEQEFDCEDRTPCFSVWRVTPSVEGDYTIFARARSSDGKRSEISADLEVRSARATATPTQTSTPTSTPNP